MIVRFWGVRGSTAAPGAAQLRYGGNTCCIELVGPGGELLVLDVGTGFCQLSDALMGGPLAGNVGRITVLLSQTHWDHLLGFPFAGIVHHPGNNLIVYGPSHAGERLEQIYARVLAPEYSPFFELANMEAAHEFRELGPEPFGVGALAISARPLPCGGRLSWGYRIEGEGFAIAYISDARYPDCVPPPAALELAQGADLLIHGAPVTRAEQQSGEGQCSVEEAISLALAARARQLLLCHHAPDRSDDALDQLLASYRAQLAAQGAALSLAAAAEGQTIALV